MIPFDDAGRHEELNFLTKWCDSEELQSVLLLTGEGGSGKTRLMIEGCRHLRHLGWHAGFLRADRTAGDLDPLLAGSAPRLVVLDYAETRLGILEPLLLKMGLAAAGQGPKLRLVLLARRKADWWDHLPGPSRQVEDLLLYSSPKPHAINPLISKNAEDRERAFRAAAEGFALQLGIRRPENLSVPDLSGGEYERVLYLHMAALAALHGERIETAADALRQTLVHERRFWHTRVPRPAREALQLEVVEAAADVPELGTTLGAEGGGADDAVLPRVGVPGDGEGGGDVAFSEAQPGAREVVDAAPSLGVQTAQRQALALAEDASLDTADRGIVQEPEGEVDQVDSEVHQGAAAGELGVEAPGLVRTVGVVEDQLETEDLPELARLDAAAQLAGAFRVAVGVIDS